MARNKRPALTSPWKIGFLVSLLLVAVSIGVGYFITRSFGLTWSWIEFHGTWTQFTFHLDAFIKEMLPLAVLVPAFALLANLAVSGAVRKYRRYLDSGQDYKRLIQSISKIEDLSDEAAIRKLTSHPELRTCLLNLRAGIVEREKDLDAREAALSESTEESPETNELATEADILVSAIVSGAKESFSSPLAITVPELKKIENAVREHLNSAPNDGSSDPLEELREDLRKSSHALRERLDEIRIELTQSEQNARELESEVSALRAHASASGPAPAGNNDAARVLSRLDSISEVIDGLGEETRSVAVKTALQASSSDASVETVVTLADEVRDVASKFNGVAEQWNEASESARHALSAVSGGGDSPHTVESLDALSNKVNMWAEQAVILSEKMRTFEEHFANAVAGATATEPVPGPQPAGDLSLETSASAPTMAEPQESPAVGVATEEFEIADKKPAVLDPGPDNGSGVDTAGFEKQKSLFSEIAGSEDNEEMFADIPEPVQVTQEQTMVDCTTVELEPTVATPEAAADGDGEEAPNRQTEYVIDDDAPESYSDVVEAQPSDDDDTMITGPKFSEAEEPVKSHAMPDIELETPASTVTPVTETPVPDADDAVVEDDAVDLYVLGAVDYEPENVHHNA